MVPHGSSLSLTASTGANSQFVGWTVAGLGTACSGTGSCTTTITGPTTITATFALNQSLEVTKAGTGSGTVSSNPTGINCGLDCSETYPPATSVTLTASAAADSTFGGWSGGGCSGTGMCTVTVTGATLVTATFTLRQFTLTVNKAGLGSGGVTSTPTGINCGSTCSAQYDAGTLVTLTAAPTAGSLFAGWSGGGCTGTSTCQVTMSAATTVTATFTPILHTLTVLRSGAGSGTVTSTPTGINCGADCVEDYAQGAMVTLAAAPSPGSTFMGWSGAGCAGTGSCVVTMNAATTVTATFTAMTVPLTVAKAGTGTGTVTSSPAGINCGADCTEAYTVGTGVTLSAAADVGSVFAGWSGGGCAGTGTCMVTLSTAQTVTATFTLNTYGVNVTKAGTGAGTVTSSPAGINCGADCSENFGHGTMVTLTAAPAVGSTFASWSGGGCTGTSTCVLTVTAAAAVTATFTANQVTLTVTKTGGGSGTVTSSPAGINCGTDCTETVNYGTTLTLSATPTAGSIFNGWTGGGCTGTGTCAVTVTGATSVAADFALAPYALTVTKAGTGAGAVTSSPTGINCGTDCTEAYTNGTVVTLTAAAAAGSTFSGWSGGGCTGTGTCAVTITSAITVTATFTLNTYPLNVTLAGTGTGTVTSSPAGIGCGTDCSEMIGHGTVVTLTATPVAGSTFTGWSGGGCTGTGTCAVTVTARDHRHRDLYPHRVHPRGHQGRHRRGHRDVVAGRHRLRRDLLGELRPRHLGDPDRDAQRRLDLHRLERGWLLRHRDLCRVDDRRGVGHRDVHAQHVPVDGDQGRHRRGHRDVVAGRHQLRRRLHRDRRPRDRGDPHRLARRRLELRELVGRRLHRHRHLRRDGHGRDDRHCDLHAQHVHLDGEQGRHRRRHRHLVARRHQLRRRLQ
jgi:hypothetical protein